MQRRNFVRALFAAPSIGVLYGACDRTRRAPTAEEVVDSLYRHVAAPACERARTESERLLAALRRLSSDDRRELGAVRESYRAALLAWQEVRAVRLGPLNDVRAIARTLFWPIRKPRLLELIGSGPPQSLAELARLGVDLKGMFALEQLLFVELERAPDAATQQRWRDLLSYARALAEEVVASAAELAGVLRHGGELPGANAEVGRSTVAALTNQMLADIETIVADRLDRVLTLEGRGSLASEQVQGGASGTSVALPRSWLHASQKLYLGERSGLGLGALVAPIAPEIDRAVRSAYGRALAGFAPLGDDLKLAARSRPAAVAALMQALKDLERALKIDVASALGVTLTFISTDGD